MSSVEEQKKQLYSRQEYVIGAEAQAKYGATDVLVVGASGLGAEIVKNLALTGVRSIKIIDDAVVQLSDLGTNFFFKKEDVGRPRALATAAAAQDLNRFVKVCAVPQGDLLEHIAAAHVVVYVNYCIALLGEVNALARQHNTKFVACESRGIAGCVFVDGGDHFKVVDADGEETVSCVVTGVSSDGLVTLHDDRNHEREVGDRVYFTGLVSPAQANSIASATDDALRLFEVCDVVSPHILRIKNFPVDEPIILGPSTYMHTTKKQLTMRFMPLSEAITHPEYATIFDCDVKLAAPPTLHAVFRAVAQFGSVPRSAADVETVMRAARDMDRHLDEAFAREVLAAYAGDLCPMASFIGGIAAQEALKLCSGKFTPLRQWLYFDVRELLEMRRQPATVEVAQDASDSGRFAGQVEVLGPDFQAFLCQQQAFIIGAGALGCELIKCVALMGFGGVSITDMDHIEMSNLSRQFLFRSHHIGNAKSTVAGAAARGINPDLLVATFEEKVGPETEGLFNETFWARHAVVLNALDNVSSRRYVDERCVFYKRPLFESGTLGAKCNMQCVIPYVTESYGSSYDPPEKAIPLCTLKNFPNAIEHTIQWARDQFHLLFCTTPDDVNRYLQDPHEFAESLEHDPAGASVVLKHVNDALRRWPSSDEDCVRLARLFFHEFFNENFKHLLRNMPLDKRDEDGKLFWSGAKKPPTPQDFDLTSARDVGFIYHCACLLSEAYGMAPLQLTEQEAAAVAAAVIVPEFVPRHVIFATSEDAKVDHAAAQLAGDITLKDLPLPQQFASRAMRPLVFEKDDPTNHQMEFITYCSNVRAEAYGIPATDLVHTKRIAGNIIPAMVTATSLVTGLVGFEVLKYLYVQYRSQKDGGSGGGGQQRPTALQGRALLSYYRNAFVNLALPLFTFSDPIAAVCRSYAVGEGDVTIHWTLWDRIDVNEGRDITMQALVDLLGRWYHLEIFMIALPSGRIVYTQFGGKAKDREKAVSQLAAEKGERFQSGEDYLSLVATGMIGDNEEVDVPLIRYKFRNF